MRSYWVYILGSRTGTLYVGLTSDLELRVAQHRAGTFGGFTARYAVHRLLYFEETTEAIAAIAREKQIKGWRRSKKVDLIQAANPGWRDLSAG